MSVSAIGTPGCVLPNVTKDPFGVIVSFLVEKKGSRLPLVDHQQILSTAAISRGWRDEPSLIKARTVASAEIGKMVNERYPIKIREFFEKYGKEIHQLPVLKEPIAKLGSENFVASFSPSCVESLEPKDITSPIMRFSDPRHGLVFLTEEKGSKKQELLVMHNCHKDTPKRLFDYWQCRGTTACFGINYIFETTNLSILPNLLSGEYVKLLDSDSEFKLVGHTPKSNHLTTAVAVITAIAAIGIGYLATYYGD